MASSQKSPLRRFQKDERTHVNQNSQNLSLLELMSPTLRLLNG
jgi:hypothetical protein